jgi:uncharacterized protein YdaU (DUF1376 family)
VKNPWLAWYPGDYISKTRHLSMGQHGAYMLLLWEYYINGPLLANATGLLNVCCAKSRADRADVDYILVNFFDLEDGFYHHKRADIEMARRESIREQRRLVGKKGGLAKARVLLEQKPTQSQSQSHIELKSKALRTFVRPTLEEVTTYCSERKNQVDSAKWFDYYSSNGWHVGKNSMRDWRAAVRTWEKNGYGGPFNDGQTQGPTPNFRGKSERRVNANRAAIIAGLGLGAEVRRDQSDLQDRDAAGRDTGMEKLLRP